MHERHHLLESCLEQATLPDGPDPMVEPKTRSRARLPKHAVPGKESGLL